MSRIFQFFFSVLLLIGGTLFSGNFAYVTNSGDGTVSVISTSSHTVIDTIIVGKKPYGVVLTPDGKYAYVTNSGDGTVSVIDTTTNTVIGNPIPVQTNPRGLDVDPKGEYVYVANKGGNLSVISTSTQTVVKTMGDVPPRIVKNPSDVVVSTCSETMFTMNQFTIIYMGRIDNSFFYSPIGEGTSPQTLAVAISKSGGYSGEILFAIEPTIRQVLFFPMLMESMQIPLNIFPRGVAISPDGSHAYITGQTTSQNGSPSLIDVFDVAAQKVINTIPLESLGAEGITLIGNGNIAYVANSTDGTVSVVDLVNQVVLSTITVGSEPMRIAGI